MVSESAETLRLLRERDRQKRTMQVWIGLVVVWGVVIGWVAFLTVRSLFESAGPLVAWLTYLIPLAVLAIVAALHAKRLRDLDGELLAASEADRRR